MATDDVTTTVRGKLVHVFDVTKAIFIHAATTGEHVAFQATYSLGCPGDSSGDAVDPVFSSNKENIEIFFIMIQSKFPDHFFLIVFQEMGGHTIFHRFIV